MTQKNPSGYPLPSGTLGEDEIVCQLVYLPDRDEYWQALYGAIAYMATWTAWERDSAKRGADAAANWREALELTTECWRMACLEDLTTAMQDILLLLQNKKDCCDDNLTYLPQVEVDTDIDPGVGDPPDYYGETAVTDWDDWSEHVCHNAHLYVDYLVSIGYQLMQASQTSAIVIGLVAAGLALLAFSGIGLPIAYGLAAGIVSGIVLGGTITTFDDTGTSIESARDDIVCALLNGGSLSDAVETALSSGTDWDLFFQFIDYDTATAIIYEGGYDSEYLPSDTKDDCADCGLEQLEDSDLEVWVVNTYGGNLQWHSGTKTWTVDSGTPGSCKNIWVQFYTDDTRTTRKLVRVEYVSCDDNSTCAGAKHHRGYTGGLASLVYELDHPTLPDVSDGEIHEIYDTHNLAFSIEFKLYEPS